MIRFFQLSGLLEKLYPNYLWKVRSNESIFLTFDDGPSTEATPWVLNELSKYNASATFFCLGSKVSLHPELTMEIFSRGHKIGNHTHDHYDGWKTSTEAYLRNIRACDTELDKIGIQTKLFRPPYGRIKTSQSKQLPDKEIVMWSHMAYDFDSTLPTRAAIRWLSNAKPGSILVFHDNAKSFSQLRQLLSQLVEIYLAKGYKLEALP